MNFGRRGKPLKSIITSVKNMCIKLKGKVGMVVPKSTQTRVVGIITYMVHPYACFSHYGHVQLPRLATLVCPLHISEPC